MGVGGTERENDMRGNRTGREGPKAGPEFLWRQPRASGNEGIREGGVAESRKARRWGKGGRRLRGSEREGGRRLVVRAGGGKRRDRVKERGRSGKGGTKGSERAGVPRKASLFRARRKPRPSLGGRQQERPSGGLTRVERGDHAEWTPARWRERRAVLGEGGSESVRRGVIWNKTWVEGSVGRERRGRLGPISEGGKGTSVGEAGLASRVGVLDSRGRRLVRRRGSQADPVKRESTSPSA